GAASLRVPLGRRVRLRAMRLTRLALPDAGAAHAHSLSLHDALPIWFALQRRRKVSSGRILVDPCRGHSTPAARRRPPQHSASSRSEEHTSELQSPYDLVCRLLLEKKNNEK